MSTSIEWTDETWNPLSGCSKVSPGCDHCYAETIAHRFAGTTAYPDGFKVTLRWRRPRALGHKVSRSPGASICQPARRVTVLVRLRTCSVVNATDIRRGIAGAPSFQSECFGEQIELLACVSACVAGAFAGVVVGWGDDAG